MISNSPLLFGVFGNPVSHSLSPIMHNAAFADLEIDGIYLPFRIVDIASAIIGVRAFDMRGVSVTIPHKVTVMDHLDTIDPMALRIGAVNTIVNREGTLGGYNTDWLGAVKALEEKTDIFGRKVAMIGAGGAARAIGYGMVEKGAVLTVCNRSRERGERLADALEVEFLPLSDLKGDAFDILINTTSLGMTPDTETTPVKKSNFHERMVVMDIVYNPLRTRFLREAEEAGCLTVDGVSMFVYQGAAQFELWTGEKAPVDTMRNTVLNALNNETQKS